MQGISKNIAQCRNIHQKINKQKSIGYDALFNINVLAQELKNVKWIQSVPYLIVIATDDQICKEVNDLLVEFDGHVLFTYDTTFNIGDFFLSPLLCRHPFLKNDVPFPVAYLYHDSKEELVHKIFFQWITEVNINIILSYLIYL